MKAGLAFLLFFTFSCLGQNQLTIGKNESFFGVSVSDKLSYFEDESGTIIPQDFLEKKSTLKEVKMTSKLENLDFKTSSIFIHFTLKNTSGKDQFLVLETAYPYTNKVSLFCVNSGETEYSGDAIPFDAKSIPTNCTALPLFVPSDEKREYVLQFISEGEKMSVPIYFFDRIDYLEKDANRKMFIGIFLGIFIFVSIIYCTFFVMLKERLFLIYVLYAFFSGLMQFSIDGYMHEFVFTSGGYFTQHVIIFVSGLTVILGMLYTTIYLALKGILKKIVGVIIAIVVATVLLSLIPEIPFEIIYQLIMFSSLAGMILMIAVGYMQREKISYLYLIGLTCLMLGAIVFILGNMGIFNSPIITNNALKIGTLLEMIFLSILMAGRYRTLQQERENVQKELLVELEEKNRIVSETNQRLEVEVGLRTREIEKQRLELKEQNEDFMSSVIYAKRIQNAVLSNEEKFKKTLPKSFVLLKPKDVVSGDFYWVDELQSESAQNQVAYITADCTGHGVPGAIVSVIANHLLETVNAQGLLSNPGKALDQINIGMYGLLNSAYATERLHDGMDLTLCVIDLDTQILSFAGARNSAYIIRDTELIVLKGQRKSIGFNHKEDPHTYSTQEFQLQKGDMIYTCTDGYADQFGGEKGKKFMMKQLRERFMELSKFSIDEQKTGLVNTLENWMDSREQLDDILVVGVRV